MLDISSEREEEDELEDESLDSRHDKRFYFREAPTDF